MESKGVKILSGIKYEEINPKGMVIKTKEGERKLIEADTVIIVNRYKKNNELHEALKGTGPELYLIGDAKQDQPGYIIGAIHDGAKVGLRI
jgi:2,4-dienoyl-CoA reductase (NADPH2)